MPTAKPRINITLPTTLAATVRRLSELQGRSMSGTIVDLLEVAQPALERAVVAIEAVRNIEGEAKASMLMTVLKELRHLEQVELHVTGQRGLFDELEARTVQAVERAGATQVPAERPARGRSRKRAKPK